MRPLLLLSLALALSAVSSAQAQDAAAGEKLFLQCRACHRIGDTAKNAVQSVRLLSDSARLFATRVVEGLEVDRKHLAANVSNALLLATALNPVLGYDRVAQITAKALAEGTTPREAAVALAFLTDEEYDRLVDPRTMAGPTG